MASKYWIKLYISDLDNEKLFGISPAAYRLRIEIMLYLAKRGKTTFVDSEINDIAWILHKDSATFFAALSEIVAAGLFNYKNGCYSIRPTKSAMQSLRNRLARAYTNIFSAIERRDGRKCNACGITESLSIDHIVPLTAGGSNSLTNLQILCRRCNSSKGGA